MHTIYTITLSVVLIIAASLQIVALRFSSGKTIIINTAYERPQILIAQNAYVAQTSVGIDDLNCMRIMKTHNVLYMHTTSTFAHATHSKTCALHALLLLLSILLRNAPQSLAKQQKT